MLTHNIIRLEEVDSTNKYAQNLIKQGNILEGTVISTNFQLKGKGHGTNKWISNRNENLLFSIILFPKFLTADKQFTLHKISALTLTNVLKKLSNNWEDFKIKWPNDIYFKNKKLAGVLTENSISGNTISSSIIGIGLNVNQKEFDKTLPNPISIQQITGNTYNCEFLLEAIIDEFEKVYSTVKQHQDYCDDLYLKNLYQFDIWKQYKTKNQIFEGKITGIDSYGFLKIQKKNGDILAFDFKEVEYL